MHASNVTGAKYRNRGILAIVSRSMIRARNRYVEGDFVFNGEVGIESVPVTTSPLRLHVRPLSIERATAITA
jgi:hypothetical protein